jgi:hypothetical protein
MTTSVWSSAVLGDGDLELDRRALAEPGLDPLGVARPEIDEEVELVVRAVSENGHRALLVRGRADASASDGCELSVPSAGRPARGATNDATRTDADLDGS